MTSSAHASQFLQDNRETMLEELKSILSYPSISGQDIHLEDCRRCAELIAEMLRRVGMEEVSLHPTPGGQPIVMGRWCQAPDKPTVLIYGHYDVQPVDPLDEWIGDPFSANIQNNRLIARGTADDKGQVFMHLKALEAVYRVDNGFPLNVKVVIEGQEEIGSRDLRSFLLNNKDDLSCDLALVSDTMMWGEGMPSITYGLRGIVYLEIEVIGPNRDLHSGSYGGVVANPAEVLARMIASAKDDRGKILIPGFYDRVVSLSDEETARIRAIPFDEKWLREELGVEALVGEEGFSVLERLWVRPTLEINGIWGGYTSQGSKTVLPAKAGAKISARLVPNQNPEEIYDLIEEFFRRQAPRSVKVNLIRHHGGAPAVMDINQPYIKAAERALEEAFQSRVLYIREGGSIPIVQDFKDILGVETLLVGFALPDARAHSPNENIHLPTMWTGMDSLVRLYYNLSQVQFNHHIS